MVRVGRGASISSRSAGCEGGRLIRICRLEVSDATLLRLRFRGAPLFLRNPVGRVDLFPHPLLGLSRLGRLLRFGTGRARGGSPGSGQAAAAQGGKQEQ